MRDLFLNRISPDLDIATSALPNEVEQLFPKTINVGKAFGTIVVVDGNLQVEVTTFRRDGEYLDGRHPKEVFFSDEKEDAARRDFTMNAMFYDPFTKRLIDYFDGQSDIKKKIIKAVGDATIRFKEDKLRMMRAIRFESQLGFRIDDETERSIVRSASQLNHVSKERVLLEMEKMSIGVNSALAIWKFETLGLWRALFENQTLAKPILPEEWIYFGLKNFESTITFLLFKDHLNGLNLVSEFKKWPINNAKKSIILSALNGVQLLNSSLDSLEKLKVLSHESGLIALELWKMKNYFEKSNLSEIQKIVDMAAEKFTNAGVLPQPIITGKDVLSSGIKPGPEVKVLIDKAYRKQIFENSNREELLQWLSQHKNTKESSHV